MKTYVYIDGFNLYYGAVKDTPYRWLDPKALVEKLLRPEHDIVRIKYFTARISALPHNPQAPERQDVYLRALESLPDLQIIYGHFLTSVVTRPRADGRGMVKIRRIEEKGSDVNLATHLVADAFSERFDAAVVVTNDSDLCEPIRIVARELRRPVGVLMPVARPGRTKSRSLRRAATFWKPIRTGPVRDSQFPDVVEVGDREVHRPAQWR